MVDLVVPQEQTIFVLMQKEGNIRLTHPLGQTITNHPKIEDAVLHEMVGYKAQFDREFSSGSNVAELMSEAYQQLDALEKEHLDKKDISCRTGCNHCCHINVSMTQWEARTIKKHMSKENITVDRTLFEKQKGLSDIERVLLPRAESRCAFLGENGLCRIYSVRPLNCRKYFVVTPPELCGDFGRSVKVAIKFDVTMEIVTSAFINTEHAEYKHMSDHFI